MTETAPERWAPIVISSVDTGYQISSYGRARMRPLTALLKKRFNIGRPRRNRLSWGKSRGYRKIKIKHPSDGNDQWFYVHLLVMEAFGPPKPFPEALVDHKDGNKLNCSLGNLEWVTPAENTRRAYAMGLAKPKRGEKNVNSKLNEEQVAQIRKFHRIGLPDAQIAKLFGVSRKTVYNIARGKKWAHSS